MSSSEYEKKERRWGRRGQAREDRSSDKPKEYVPPSLSDTSDFVTSPPKQRGLTTGISTLFRRAGTKEPSGGELEVAPAVGDTTLLQNSLAGISMSRTNSRLFSNDDSDDSYESRVSAISRDEEDDDDDPVVKAPIRRFRGFSTSVQSLFLDESLVCVSIGCFGLLLSQRTEFLLDVRNRQRGSSRRAGNKSVHRYPSRVISYALLVTILLMGGTFVVLGFGSSQTLQQYTEGDYYDVLEDDGQVYYENTDDDGRFVNDDANGGNQSDDAIAGNQGDDASAGNQGDDANGNGRLLTSMRITGVFKIREYQENVWDPFLQLVHDEWHRDDFQRRLSSNAGDVGGTIRMVLALLFLVILGVVGRRRRMRTRYALVRARAQEDHLHYASGTDAKVESSEGNYEGACSHTLCGCYPADPPMQETHVELNQFGKKRKYEDCVSRGFQCLMGCCCGVLCKCWFQCMSVCALAQEAREARLLVHPKFQRIDYITHQPFSEYQAAVNDLRRGWLGKTRRKAGFVPHIQALSRLSRYILITFTSVIVILCATLLFNPLASFSWPDLIVLIATFVQAFLVLYVVHWIFHKSDLSLDAVVKFFAAGFAIAVPTAFVLEGLLINILLAVTYSLYGVIEGIRGEVFVSWVVKHYRFLWILGELINAYIVAAVTEELCKYYTFRSIEHPDLVFLTGLNRNEQASDAVVGGVISYPYGSHQVQQLNRNNSFESVSSSRSTRSTKSATQVWIDSAATDEEFFEDENDVRTHRQKAAALTTGMISVAVGLACAENFLYVFFLGGTGSDGEGTIKEEWIVLFFRSIFPVHALAAAMQSIGMIRKFVECTSDANNHRIGVGRVILPAVVLHGSFDAVLLGINVYVESSWDTYLQANGGKVEEGVLPYNAAIVNTVAWLSIVSIMIGGILWYFREYRNQLMRLKILEQEEFAAEGGSYSPTKGGPPTEVELV